MKAKILTLISLFLLVAMMASATACANKTSSPTGAPSQAQVQPIKIVFSSHEPPAGLQKDFFDQWFSDLEKATGGRVKVEAHWAGELAGPSDAYEAVAKGTVDMAEIMPMMTPGRSPMDDVVSLPSYDTLSYRPSRVWWELLQKFPEMRVPYQNTKLLWVGALIFNGVATVKKPVRELKDNMGLKMGVTGPWAAARGQALGWVPVSLPPQDVYLSAQRGVVDGGLYGTPYMLRDMKWGEVFKYITMVNSNRVLFAAVMSQKEWNSLPADIQKTMEGMTDSLVDRYDELNVRLQRERIASAPKEFGTEFIELSPQEIAKWVEVDKPVLNAFAADLEAKGLPGKKLLDEYLKLEKKYSAPEYSFK